MLDKIKRIRGSKSDVIDLSIRIILDWLRRQSFFRGRNQSDTKSIDISCV